MKIYRTFFTLMMLASVAAGCVKEIEFDGETTRSRLNFYCVAAAGKPLQAEISHSLFFIDLTRGMDRFVKDLDLENGFIALSVNGAFEERLQIGERSRYAQLYNSRYIPRGGDSLAVTAWFPGFDTLHAATRVPATPKATITKIEVDLEAVETADNIEIEVEMEDDGSMAKYYRIDPYIPVSYYAPVTDPEAPLYYYYYMASNDYIFMDLDSSIGLDDITEPDPSSEPAQVPGVFSDVLIRGTKFRFSMVPMWIHVNNWDGTLYLHLRIRAMSPALYYYFRSKERINPSSDILSEGVTLYSNVKGGYGLFAATSDLYLPVE